MATCPSCGTKSRQDPTAFVVEEVLAAKPFGTFSLSGQTLKTSAHRSLRLRCRCGWSILGYVDDGSFYGDPATQAFPPRSSDSDAAR